MMVKINSVLVTGGGVAGMTAAIMLARAGLTVKLVDADPNWRALGAGVTLNGGALRAFHRIGLLDRVLAVGAAGGSATICHPDGTPAFAPRVTAADADGVPAVGGIMRPALHRVLQEATNEAGVAVELGKPVVNLKQSEAAVDVEFGDGSRERFDLVVGADGVNSTVRSLIFPDAEKPTKFVGQGCWRAVTARPESVKGPMAFFGRQHCGVNPVSADKMYLFLLQTVPGDQYIPEESWIELLKEHLSEFTAPILRDIAANLSVESQINYRPLEAGILPQPWYQGRVILIGDAVHSPTPHSAYGAGLGIEDGIALAEELSKSEPLDTALANFMARRFARCQAIVETAVRQSKLQQSDAPIAEYGPVAQAMAQIIAQPF